MKWVDRISLDKEVRDYFRKFQKKHPGYSREHKLTALLYLLRLNKKQFKMGKLKKVPIPARAKEYAKPKKKKIEKDFRYFLDKNEERLPLDEMKEQLEAFDVISFDIFDTLLYRKVESPQDIFRIMSLEMGFPDFQKARRKAEIIARERNDAVKESKECTLDEVYAVLNEIYDIDSCWKEREIELEMDLCEANPYMLEVFRYLREKGKTVLVMSDMYLPRNVIEDLLAKIGVTGYEKLYLSNEYLLRKEDGTLQLKVLEDYPEKRIVHVGDSRKGDVEMSETAGITGVYNPNQHFAYKEPCMNSLGGSFYRAIIENRMNCGLWDENLYYEHGFRVGGILAAGYCQYLNRIVKEQKIDKILFCSRDCEIIHKAYNQFFKECDNDYITISTCAILGITSERNIYDFAIRFLFRSLDEMKSTKTFEQIFIESGFEYLVDALEEADIEKYMFPCFLPSYKKRMETFLFDYKQRIIEHEAESRRAAIKYYGELVPDKNSNILIVDIGWSGTCITALKYFYESALSHKGTIRGALMCTSRKQTALNSIEDGTICSYVYSPVENMDLARFMMPDKVPEKEQDLLHMPLEFMFSSLKHPLLRYGLSEDNEVSFEYAAKKHENTFELTEMQRGILEFIRIYTEHTKGYPHAISPYAAFAPLKAAISHTQYCYEVYKNFTYDAFSAVNSDEVIRFWELFESTDLNKKKPIPAEEGEYIGRILFVTPELSYTGTPRSLLRMCRVAKSLHYQPVVWSPRRGPFMEEFRQDQIEVEIVTEQEVKNKKCVKRILSFDMAVCNTIMTDTYAEVLSKHIPVCWYIREATNIPDFIRNDRNRAYRLRKSRNLYCVSEYARQAIEKYAEYPVSVIHNSVEDEADMALPYVPGQGEAVKFVQFGTMEYRKGYDILVSAFIEMPKEYQDRCELFFAGGFISFGTPFCAYLFERIRQYDRIHYLGLIKGEKNKIETLSQMDVVVVASRDESCSLVTLEGAMLSKPLIVTENVGAKYMVTDENGIVVPNEDVKELSRAMMRMIDQKSSLKQMGQKSREMYESKANMESYTRDLQELFRMCERKDRKEEIALRKQISRDFSKAERNRAEQEEQRRNAFGDRAEVIVSLTSHPGRIKTVSITIQTLLDQTCLPKKILLWLSKEQFENGMDDLPEDLIELTEDKQFEIRWTEDDLKPHKKYFYVKELYPDLPLIIVDDDVRYKNNMVDVLMKSYLEHPDCISCMRADLIMLRPDGTPRTYKNWPIEYWGLLGVPSYQLVPTGIGGVLYPPKALSEEVFNKEVIRECCLLADDLWLKIMTMDQGYRAVIPSDFCKSEQIPGTQDVALWRDNIEKNRNDQALERVLIYYDSIRPGGRAAILEKMKKDMFL